MYLNHCFMRTEISDDNVRFYFNYEEEQAIARADSPDLEEHPNKEKYTDFDYTIPFNVLPDPSIIPVIEDSVFRSQFDNGITEEWAWQNGGLDLGEAIIFKNIQTDSAGNPCEMVRMFIGELQYFCDSKDWKGTCLSYE